MGDDDLAIKVLPSGNLVAIGQDSLVDDAQDDLILARRDQIPALRDALAPHDERVADGSVYRIDPNPDGGVGVWQYLAPDDARPRLIMRRPHGPEQFRPEEWVVWRAVLAGLGLADVE